MTYLKRKEKPVQCKLLNTHKILIQDNIGSCTKRKQIWIAFSKSSKMIDYQKIKITIWECV